MSTFKDRLEKTLWILYVPSFYFCVLLITMLFADIVSAIIFQNANLTTDWLEERRNVSTYLKVYAFGFAPIYLFFNWLMFNKKEFLPKHIVNLSDNWKLGIVVLYIAWLILLIISNKV
jgi:hypothetical protein